MKQANLIMIYFKYTCKCHNVLLLYTLYEIKTNSGE
jgi:hypothetical protein